MEPYQAAGKKYQQALTLFRLEKPREFPPQTHHLHSRRLITVLGGGID